MFINMPTKCYRQNDSSKVKLLIVACITALTPIIYNSVYSDLIATH